MGLVSRPPRSPEDSAADLELVRRVAAGDRGAVDDLYQRFRRPAFALARRVLGDDVLAEDVLQDVFLGIWRDPGAFDGSRGSVASWLLTMVHHKAVDAVRREESHRRRRSGPRTTWRCRRRPRPPTSRTAAWERLVAERVRDGAAGAAPAAARGAHARLLRRLHPAGGGGAHRHPARHREDAHAGRHAAAKDMLGTGLPGRGRHGRGTPDDPRAAPAATTSTRSWDELAVGWALHALEPEDEAAVHRPPGRLCPLRADRRRDRRGDGRHGRRTAPGRAVRGPARAAAGRRGGDRAGAAGPPGQRAAPAAAGDVPARRSRSATATSGAPAVARPGPDGRPGAGCCPRPWSRPPSPRSSPWPRGTSWSAATGTPPGPPPPSSRRCWTSCWRPAGWRSPPSPRTARPWPPWSPGTTGSQVVASGLPVNDSHDQVYVLWGMQDDLPQPLGTFDVVTPQTDLRTVGSSATGLDDYSGYAISIEPGRQAPSFPTDVIGQGEVTS